jgi:hypothetical protein
MVDVERRDPMMATSAFHRTITKSSAGPPRASIDKSTGFNGRTTYYRADVCKTGLGQSAFARARAGQID